MQQSIIAYNFYQIYNIRYLNDRGSEFLKNHLNAIKEIDNLKDFVQSSFCFKRTVIQENQETQKPIVQFRENSNNFELFSSGSVIDSRIHDCIYINKIPSITNNFINLHREVNTDFLSNKNSSILYLVFILNNDICLISEDFNNCITKVHETIDSLSFKYHNLLFKYIKNNIEKNPKINILSKLLDKNDQEKLLLLSL